MDFKEEARLKSGEVDDLLQQGALDMPLPTSVFAITYSDFVEQYLESSAEFTRDKRTALTLWLEYLGTTLDTQIADEFGLQFESLLARFRDEYAVKTSAKSSANRASDLRAIRASYLRMLKSTELPAKLSDAIQAALRRKGLSAHSLRETFPESVYHWAVGNTTPKRNGSLPVLHMLEDFLELPHDSLVVRAHKRPIRLHDLSKEVPWRTYMGIVRKHQFRLKYEQLCPALAKAFEEWTECRTRSEHLLPNGTVVSLKRTETWNSPATVEIRQGSFLAFFGFLALPKATKPESKMGWEEKMGFGMGVPVEDLRFTMLVNKDYLFAYMRYCEMRTYDKTHFENEQKIALGQKPAGMTPKKSLSSSFLDFTIAVNNLVNKPHSFLRLNPAYAQEVAVAPGAWTEWLELRHTEILSIATAVRDKVVTGKRSNKELLQGMLRQDNPLQMMHDVLEQMRKDTPPNTAPMWVACHARDVALLSLLIFDPLRIKNLSELELGKHIVQNSEGRYCLQLDADLFKNFIWGHAENRFRKLPLDVEADLINWLKLRKNLPGHDQTDIVFMAVQKKNSNKGRPFELNRNSFYTIMNKYTMTYFGLHIGTHAMRTLVTSAVARVGTPNQVKSILNDSEEIAMEHYRDARNADEFKGLDDIHESLRSRKSGGTR